MAVLSDEQIKTAHEVLARHGVDLRSWDHHKFVDGERTGLVLLHGLTNVSRVVWLGWSAPLGVFRFNHAPARGSQDGLSGLAELQRQAAEVLACLLDLRKAGLPVQD